MDSHISRYSCQQATKQKKIVSCVEQWTIKIKNASVATSLINLGKHLPFDVDLEYQDLFSHKFW